MEELKIVLQQGVIKCNFEQLEAEVRAKIKEYENAVFTEETISSAEKVVTDFRKDKLALSDKRIEKEREFMKPFYEQVSDKIKSLSALYDNAIADITKQLDVYEIKRKTDKKAEIENLYKNAVGDVSEFIPFLKIYNTRWENKTFKTKDIILEMNQLIESVKNSVDAIRGMNSDLEYTETVLNEFKSDLSLSNAIAKINKHEQVKAKIEADLIAQAKAKEDARINAEIERAKADERKKLADQSFLEESVRKEERAIADEKVQQAVASTKQVVYVQTPAPVQSQPIVNTPFTENGKQTATFTIIATPEEIQQVENYLKCVGLSFDRQ